MYNSFGTEGVLVLRWRWRGPDGASARFAEELEAIALGFGTNIQYVLSFSFSLSGTGPLAFVLWLLQMGMLETEMNFLPGIGLMAAARALAKIFSSCQLVSAEWTTDPGSPPGFLCFVTLASSVAALLAWLVILFQGMEGLSLLQIEYTDSTE